MHSGPIFKMHIGPSDGFLIIFHNFFVGLIHLILQKLLFLCSLSYLTPPPTMKNRKMKNYIPNNQTKIGIIFIIKKFIPPLPSENFSLSVFFHKTTPCLDWALFFTSNFFLEASQIVFFQKMLFSLRNKKNI